MVHCQKYEAIETVHAPNFWYGQDKETAYISFPMFINYQLKLITQTGKLYSNAANT